MGKKRRQDLRVSGTNRPQKKQQQDINLNDEDSKIEEPIASEDEDGVEVIEEEASDDRATGHDEEEEENGSGEGDEEHELDENHSLIDQVSSLSAMAATDDDEDSIEKLLEPFGKDQILSLLKEAADKHTDVADRIRVIADMDPVHRKIFVHGLGWDTTAETLINAFKMYGEIEDCKAVTDKISGKSKGYGFILFRKRSAARRALREPQKKIGNRMTACQLASVGPVLPQGMLQPAFTSQQVSEYTQRKIYVSNVGSDVDPQKLTAFFAKFGDIEEGPLGLDKVTKKPKGFCLFVYRSVESARKALEEPHKVFERHILHCQKAIDGPKTGKNPKQQRTSHSSMQTSQFQHHSAGSTSGPGHLMAAARPAAGAPTVNPAIGQALTALLAAPSAGLGLTNFLGNLGSVAAVNQAVVPVTSAMVPTTYGNLANMHQGLVGTYGTPIGIQTGYQNQPLTQGGSGRGQLGLSQYGGSGPYMGH